MIIDYSSCGPLRERFEQDNIESILESGETGINNYFNRLKQEGLIDKFEYNLANYIWIGFESKTTGFGEIIIK